MKVLLIGSYPPPIGGNSVHIQRLQRELRSRDIECDVVDIYGTPGNIDYASMGIYRVGPANIIAVLKAIAIMCKKPYDVIHFHVSAMDRFAYAGLLFVMAIPKNSKSVVSIHSGQFSETYRTSSAIKKMLVKLIFKRFDQVIPVVSEQQTLLRSIGVDKDAIHVIPAYLPPTVEAFPAAESILERLREDGKTVVLSSGYGEPLYGYHSIIAAIKNNAVLQSKVSLLLCLYNKFDENYMAKIKSELSELDSFEVLYDLTPEQFAYTLGKCDLYIRATSSDGDAVAIREAAHFGVPILASDSSERPSYCTLFHSGDPADLARRLTEHLESKQNAPQNANTPTSNIEKIIGIYNNP